MTKLFKTGITVEGTINTSGVLASTQSAPNEGGQIELTLPSSGSTLSGSNVTIDIYQNRLRFFESGGTNRGYYLDITSGGATVGSNLATGGSYTAPILAGTTLSSGGTIDTLSGTLTADIFSASSNGLGTNFKVGDDAWIGDINTANTIRVKGIQNSTNGYIVFGDSDTKSLGRSGTGALTFDGNTIWHAGNDGASSGLDADTLDGNHASAFSTTSFTTITTPSGTSPVADATSDTLTLTTDSYLTITGTASTDTIDFATGATSSNTASKIVARDASGNFSAGIITATTLKYGTGTGAPTFTTYSSGVREIYYDNIGTSSAGYAVGIEAGYLWYGVPDTTNGHKWYAGTTNIATLSGAGTFTATAFSGSGASLTSLNASNIGSGTVPIGNIPTGTTGTTVALGNHTHSTYLSTSTMTSLGDTIYGGASGTATRLAGPTVNGTYVLTSVPSAGVSVAPSWALASGLTVSSATSATNTTNVSVTNDAATATSVYPTWVGANTGNNGVKTTSAALSFVPSTGTLTATAFSGSGASLTSLNASNIGSGTVPIGNIPTGTTGTTVALGNHTHSGYLSTTGGALTGAVTYADVTSIEGRVIASSGVFYVQAGTDASDTTGTLTISRTLTTSTAINAFNIFATTSTFTGNVTTTGTINQQYTDWTYLAANFR